MEVENNEDELILSVNVITYNQEKYIAKTLESILSQEHSYKYEIVIGDDCSKDKTQEIIRKYSEKYPDIIKPIFNKQNKGVIKNYFDTIQTCKGKYLMDIAGDDWFLPNKVKTQVEFMEKNPDVGMCYGKVKRFIESTGKFKKNSQGENRCSFSELIKRNAIPAPTVCIRREQFEKYISDVNPMEKNWKMEDYPMWLWFSANSKIKMLDEDFAVYREMNESVSHTDDIEKKLSFVENTIEIQNFFLESYSNEKEKNIYDYHKEKAWVYAFNNKWSRKQCLKEIKQAYVFNKRDKKLLLVSKSRLLFLLFRIRLFIQER